MHRYYLDESGNSGDLIKSDFSLEFGGQPLFALSCVGVVNDKAILSELFNLKSKYHIENELKSTDIYYKTPEFYLELVGLLVKNKTPILVELVDKKFCIIMNLISSLIIPMYNEIDETDGQSQFVRNHLADYMWHELPDKYLKLFNKVCLQREADKVIEFLIEIKCFFDSQDCQMLEKSDVSNLISLALDDFQACCNRLGDKQAVVNYLPIPDVLNKSKRKSKAKNINILPHVHSFFNIIGRLNQYHLGDIESLTLVHDEQKDFDVILTKSKEYLVENIISQNIPPSPNTNLNINSNFELEFGKSELNVGIQLADLIAGFYVRFINDVFYERKAVDNVYVKIFSTLVKYQHNSSPLGVNFVLPHQKQQSIFQVFQF
ncbi:hypothetical protein BEI46_17620 [Aliivibrio fischeri]|nr:hypothetical protein BEI46_17620 [Aliivibrio fischeri]